MVYNIIECTEEQVQTSTFNLKGDLSVCKLSLLPSQITALFGYKIVEELFFHIHLFPSQNVFLFAESVIYVANL